MRAAILGGAVFFCGLEPSLAQQVDCASRSTQDAIKSYYVNKAIGDATFWLALQINTPQYRMKEVRFEFEGLRQVGRTYAGLDCVGIVRMFSPPDVTNANSAWGKIKFILLPDGGLDFYQ